MYRGFNSSAHKGKTVWAASHGVKSVFTSNTIDLATSNYKQIHIFD